MRKFLREFGLWAFEKTGKRHRTLAALRAVVRNPMLKGEYGPNKPSTIRAKGFDRFSIDTGQLYTAIGAKVRVKRLVSR